MNSIGEGAEETEVKIGVYVQLQDDHHGGCLAVSAYPLAVDFWWSF